MGEISPKDAHAVIEGWNALSRYTGIWVHHLKRWTAYGDFPKPFVQVNPKKHVWLKEDVDLWLERKLHVESGYLH